MGGDRAAPPSQLAHFRAHGLGAAANGEVGGLLVALLAIGLPRSLASARGRAPRSSRRGRGGRRYWVQI
jgi:hypothetical protein